LLSYFDVAYLDEVQDFSYATIFLICNIAGKDAAYWVCAGDTAQMISPGCSFTFAGLKQTLLAVKEGIEESLSRVHHLLVNYRTTKDVLDVGNQILCVAKNFFPGAIEFAHPEVAVKDLGLKVVLCDWDLAW
jgi:superfamily I DNA/RNA helicase